MEKIEIKDPKISKKIFEEIRNLPDNRGLLRKILFERTFLEDEITSILNANGITNERDPENFVFYTANEERYHKGIPTAYSLNDLTPPRIHFWKPGFFKLVSKIKEGQRKFKIEEKPESFYFHKKIWGERPTNQRIIKTKLLWEANELLEKGYNLIGEKEGEETHTSCIPEELYRRDYTEKFTIYTLVKGN